MPKRTYKRIKFKPATRAVIDRANGILDEYAAQGFSLTLRQLYYQFVSRGLIANNDREYKKLGDVVADGRLAGLIDWNAIVDRTRNVRSVGHWESPADIIRAVASQYRIDKWANQRYRPEVWIEKDALVGVIEGVCAELDVPYFSCRGYTSQSEMWAAAQRMAQHDHAGQTPVILHLGDHDPSGKDMTRDIADRLELFMGGLTVDRLALNFDQVERYGPPPNPAKITDSRADAYIAEFGPESWELDALEPTVIAGLIRRAVEGIRDDDAWDEMVEREEEQRRLLARASSRWRSIASQLQEGA